MDFVTAIVHVLSRLPVLPVTVRRPAVIYTPGSVTIKLLPFVGTERPVSSVGYCLHGRRSPFVRLLCNVHFSSFVACLSFNVVSRCLARLFTFHCLPNSVTVSLSIGRRFLGFRVVVGDVTGQHWRSDMTRDRPRTVRAGGE